ncbi:MAG: site-specific integrase [Microcoleus vaginatus WJT46-NPBG5]|jgi:integrase|nr:site-specific integrase [Microcoleus vaginatus WJT46-NPBG5]
MSKTIQDLLSEVNAELKAARIAVVVRVRGDRLSLPGTFPPKPGSQKIAPHQQDLALSIYANPAGFRRAKAEALRVGGLLACKEFRWEDLGFGFKPTDSISDWLEKFERDYFNRRARTPKTETSFEDYLDTWKLFKDKGAPLTAETIKAALLKSPPDSRQRSRACIALGALAKFAGIEIDLKPYRGRYSPYAAIQERELPSDELIEEWYKLIPNPAWQWAYGIMATYGIRNHELFYLDLREFHQSPGILIIQEGGKTGQRKVWPCRHWWEKWNLGDIRLPQCTGKDNTALGQRVTRAFIRYQVPFRPYDLRHAWAVRTAITGLDISIAAKMMGHSVDVHHKLYHRWIDDRHLQAAWERTI